MRVALGAFMHESATFSHVPTDLGDFRLVSGDAFVDTVTDDHGECGGALAALTATGAVEIVPTVAAGATPSGRVRAAAYREIRRRLIDALEQARALDGVLLCLHGSTSVEDMDDAQGDLTAAVRRAVGPQVPIVATLDLHATPSDRVVESVDALVSYRTAPHRDIWETGVRAAALLERMLRQGVRPAMTIARVPLLLPGEFGQTGHEPMASLMAEARAAEATRPEIWSVSVLQGYPWADLPEPYASVVVVADPGEYGVAAARATARRLQARFWEIRSDLYRSVDVRPVADALAEARILADAGSLVYLSDSGDNPTAGADSDDARLLPSLLASGLDRVTFGAVADAPAARRAQALGPGGTLDLTVGGHPSGRPEAGVRVQGEVAAVVDDAEGGILVRIATGNTDLLISERRMGLRRPATLVSLGIDPAAPGSVHVLKSGYLFPELADLVARTPGARSILLATPGASALDLRLLPYRRVHRPVYPLDTEDRALPLPFDRPPLR